MIIVYVAIGIIAYLLGSISFSILFGKKFAGIDVRESGSKSAGTTNVLRTAGKLPAVLTLICDILKGVVAVVLAWLTSKTENSLNAAMLVQIAGLCAVLGHTFPVYFKFKGGKGVATALGILLIANWQIGLICLVFALILITVTKMVSVGSMAAAILFPVLTIFIKDNYLTEYNFSYVIFGAALALIVVYNHRANLKRLLSGTENKLSFKGK